MTNKNIISLAVVACLLITGTLACTYTDSAGVNWDLSAAAAVKWTSTGSRNGNAETWSIAACGPATWEPTSDSGYPNSENQCTTTNQVCQNWKSTDPNGDTAVYSSIVVQTPSTSPKVTPIAGGVQLDYTGNIGLGQAAMIQILCPTSSVADGTAVLPTKDVTQTYWIIPLYSISGCGKSKGALSPGSIILIAFASLLFVYIIGGLVFNKFVKKVEGNPLPNKEFWVNIPGLTKHGAMFIVNKARGKTAYSQV